MPRILATLLLLILTSTTFHAQKYYIEQTGVDTLDRDGLSPQSAWASLHYASTRITSYDTLLLGIGNFYEKETSYVPEGVKIYGQGTEHTKVIASDEWMVSDSMNAEFPSDYMIYAKNKNAIEIKNIHFLSQDTSDMPNGALFFERSDSIVLSNIFIEDFRWTGA